MDETLKDENCTSENFQINVIVQSQAKGTTKMSELQLLVMAVSNDSVEEIKLLHIPDEKLIQYRFEDNMNVLNLAIDQLRFKVIKFLGAYLKQEHKS